MFNFLKKQNELDASAFDLEQDMDLLVMIDEARSEAEIQSVIRMSRARARARRAQLRSARRPHQAEATPARRYSLVRAFR